MANEPEDMEPEGEEIELETSDASSDDGEYNPLNDVLQYRLLYAQGQELSAAGRSGLWGGKTMWSIIQSLGATLRLLAPAALLALLCGRDSPVMRLLQHCDKAVRNALFPSPSQTESVIKWLQDALPGDARAGSIDAVWADGTVLCDVIDSVVPGSCSGHADDVTDLAHAQRLAEQYLGVTPIFSKAELSQKTLSTYQECRLTHYLCCVRDAVSRLSPAVSRAGSPLLNVQAYTLDYVARGMGLVTASKNKRSCFYIYPTAQQGLEPGDISVQIKGPSESYGSTLVPVIYGKAHMIRNVFLNLGNRKNFMPVPLPLTQGASYMRTYDKMNVQKNYFIPKIKNDIDLSIIIRHDRVKVFYTPTTAGYHELSLISKGCHIIGSPFVVNVDVGSIDRQDSSDYLDEDISIEDTLKPERKVVFRIVDFVTEKMLLTEDGRLEKISNEDADDLLQTRGSIEDLSNKYRSLSNGSPPIRGPDLIEYQYNTDDIHFKITLSAFNKNFRTIAKQVILMIRICKEFREKVALMQKKTDFCQKVLTATPDIVNSTRSDGLLKESFDENKDARIESQDTRGAAQGLRQKFKSKLSSFNATTDRADESNKINSLFNMNESRTHIIQCEEKEDSGDFGINNYYRGTMQTGTSIEIIISSFDEDDDIVSQVNILPKLEEISETPRSPEFRLDELPERPRSPLFKLDELQERPRSPLFKLDELPERPKSPLFKLDELPERPKSPLFKLDELPERPKSPLFNLEEIPERPKTPVIKILTDADDEIDSKIFNEFELYKLDNQIYDSFDGFMDSYCPQIDNALNASQIVIEDLNEQGRVSPAIDFRIGEPVTPTHVLHAPISLESDMDSIILASNLEEALVKYDIKMQKSRESEQWNSEDSGSSIFGTPLRQTPFEQMTDSEILKMYEEPLPPDRDFYENKELAIGNEMQINFNQNNENSLLDSSIKKEPASIRRLIEANNVSGGVQENIDYEEERPPPVPARHTSLETWDSAYISIDEVNSSPETISNSPKSDYSLRGKLCSIQENDQEYAHTFTLGCDAKEMKIQSMGPAERELWKMMTENESKKENDFNKATTDMFTKHFPRIINVDLHISPINEDDNSIKTYIDENDNIDSINQINVESREKISLKMNLETLPEDEMKLTNFASKNTSEKLYNKNDLMKNHCLQKHRINQAPAKKLATSDDSASDYTADVKLSNQANNISDESDENVLISSVQYLTTESKDTNHKILNLSEKQLDMYNLIVKEQETCLQNKFTNDQKGTINIPNTKKPVLSKLISEKRDYWDDKIKTFQKKEEKKARSISRKRTPLIKKNDSLSKKRGRPILAKIPSVTEKWKSSFEPQIMNKKENDCSQSNVSHSSLVGRWKEYWNEKVEKTTSPDHCHSVIKKTGKSAKSNNYTMLDSTYEKQNKIDKSESHKKKGGDFLGISNREEDSTSALTYSNKEFSDENTANLFCKKYQPMPINLNTITQRIDSFLDTFSNPSPIIELDESRFSTPELPFGGIVSRRINSINNNITEKDMKYELLKIDKDDDRLKITWNNKSSERRIRAIQNASPSPSPNVQEYNKNIISANFNLGGKEGIEETIRSLDSFESRFEIKNDYEICDIECKIPIKEKDTNECEKNKLSNTISEVKTKIENFNERLKSAARENFLKHRSKTMDIPKSKKIENFKKYFSLDKVNTEETEHVNNNKKKTRSFQNSMENISTFDNDLNLSSDSISTLAERKTRIENHLQRLQRKLNSLPVESLENTKQPQDIQLPNLMDQSLPNRTTFTRKPSINENEEEMRVFKPVGDIVAAFENNLFSSENSKELSQTRCNIRSKNLLTKSFTKSPKLDAENRKGTNETIKTEPELSFPPAIQKDTVTDTKEDPDSQPINKTSNLYMSNSESQQINKNLYKPNPADAQLKQPDKPEAKDGHIETHKYKQRFLKAKKFFQTLDEIQKETVTKHDRKLNECEKLLQDLTNKQNENDTSKTIENDTQLTCLQNNIQNTKDCVKKPTKGSKKIVAKAFSAPTSDTECEVRRKSWIGGGSCRLKKISEKFHVEGLFQDVAGDYNMTRVGSFKGIPHKNAVLAAFRSMENVSQQSSYEYTVSQMEDFAKKNGIVNSQTCQSDYPYLPTTDPGKYRARYDAAASGFIQRKDLLKTERSRRNSAPARTEMQLNFITDI